MFEKWAEKFRARAEEDDVTFKNFDERATEPAPAPVSRRVEEISAPKNSLSSPENIELKVVRPESFEEVSTIADYLLDDCTVVLNLELLDKPTSLRMLDFLNGITYSKDGEIKKVAQSTYIITPNNVDVNDAEN
ncbi:MAG: cell division protein SepF [Clostridia bacterium]|nr:cell division protein SepF [Clostridia bacterium]